MNQYTKSHSREKMNQHTHKKKRFMKKIQPTQNNWCSFWKILEKVNVPNQHVIFSEIFENQHVSHVFIDHLYPSKYAIVPNKTQLSFMGLLEILFKMKLFYIYEKYKAHRSQPTLWRCPYSVCASYWDRIT